MRRSSTSAASRPASTAEELATYYRERKLMAVVFTVDAESTTGQERVPNEERSPKWPARTRTS